MVRRLTWVVVVALVPLLVGLPALGQQPPDPGPGDAQAEQPDPSGGQDGEDADSANPTVDAESPDDDADPADGPSEEPSEEAEDPGAASAEPANPSDGQDGQDADSAHPTVDCDDPNEDAEGVEYCDDLEDDGTEADDGTDHDGTDAADDGAAADEEEAAEPVGYQRVVSITFPVSGSARYGDDYHAMRGGGTRRHQATDVFAAKLQRIHAAVGGEICVISGVDEPEPYYGYSITVCGDDGLQYRYIHINNDHPGTDDGDGGVSWAYAPEARLGKRVERGQWIAYVGDSGNAEGVGAHLHFEIIDPDLSDARLDREPYKTDRIDPYNSLEDARRRGDIPAPPSD